MPHTDVQGAQPMGVTQQPELLQRRAHLCKLKQLCLCYITAQGHVVIVMRFTVQHYRSICHVNIDLKICNLFSEISEVIPCAIDGV